MIAVLLKKIFYFINGLITFKFLLEIFKKLNCPFKLTYNDFFFLYFLIFYLNSVPKKTG